MLTVRDGRQRIAARFALIGGLVLLGAALSVLFLPVLGNCSVQAGEMICSRLSYLQMGGNALGYALLALMCGVGFLAIESSRDSNYHRVRLIRWLGTVISLVVALITGWGFGIVFVPGALFLLASAVWARPLPAAS